MGINKNSISPPLEAGLSLLDARQLPLQLTLALEYVSTRLMRKQLHVSLVVGRKDISMPMMPSPTAPATSSASSSSSSPKMARFMPPSPARSVFSDVSGYSSSSASAASDAGSVASTSSTSSLSRTRWPGLPSSPRDAAALPPKPASPTLSTFSAAAAATNPWGLSLMHASTLTPRAEKYLRHYIGKAERRYEIGSGWLAAAPLTTVLTCRATNDVLRRSLAQNSVVFSSEGLTLFALDQLFALKTRLAVYSRSGRAADRLLAADELRRAVLAHPAHSPVARASLMRAYDWLPVAPAALVDVNDAYKQAYGGVARLSGIAIHDTLTLDNNTTTAAAAKRSPPALKTNFAPSELQRMNKSVTFADQSPRVTRSFGDVEVGESARGRDARLSVVASPLGPVTPNGFEDITPVTKGEWCFLMVGDGWKGRTAAVETC